MRSLKEIIETKNDDLTKEEAEVIINHYYGPFVSAKTGKKRYGYSIGELNQARATGTKLKSLNGRDITVDEYFSQPWPEQ